MNPTPTLPPSDTLPVDRLAGLFARVTNSYKFLFFMALLDEVEASASAPGPLSVHLDELARGMLTRAWYPHTLFRLSFGATDRVGQLLDGLAARAPGANRVRPNDTDSVRAHITSHFGPGSSELRSLQRYVPTRLLRPFLGEHVGSGSDVDAQLEAASRVHFLDACPLYRFDDDGQGIEVHPGWREYLMASSAIVRGWCMWEWTLYMQAKNPSTPSLVSKLIPSPRREPWTFQKTFFDTALGHGALHCPYSGAPVGQDYALDHFLPWSFVAHNRLFNLAPIAPSLNASKGSRLPHGDYVGALSASMASALGLAWSHLSGPIRGRIREEFAGDLGLDIKPLLTQPAALSATLDAAYEQTYGALFMQARRQGFEGDWRA